MTELLNAREQAAFLLARLGKLEELQRVAAAASAVFEWLVEKDEWIPGFPVHKELADALDALDGRADARSEEWRGSLPARWKKP